MRSLLASIVVLCGMGFSMPAGALAAWPSPADISKGPSGKTPQVAVDPQGNATAVWIEELSPAVFEVRTATRPVAQPWSEPVTLATGDADTRGPQVVVDAQGNATAVWSRLVAGHTHVETARRLFGQAWDVAPAPLSLGALDARNPQLAVDPQGTVTAVWERSDGLNDRVQSATRAAGQDWAAPLTASDGGVDADHPQLAIDAQGIATAVWEQKGGGSTQVYAASRPVGQDWGDPTPLSEDGEDAEKPQVAVDPQGNATAVWGRYDEDAWMRVQASTRLLGQPWDALPATLSKSASDAMDPQVIVDPQGTVTAVWSRIGDNAYHAIEARTRSVGQDWDVVDRLSPSGAAENPQVTVSREGDVTAIWERHDGVTRVQASTRKVGKPWFAADTLPTVGLDASDPQVAVDGEGNRTAVWSQSDGVSTRVYGALRDVVDPVVSGVSVPASGVVGVPFSVSAEVSDVWSPFTVTWAFADGTTAEGASVQHTYAKAGTYTVRLTARDEQGNATTEDRQITVAAPPPPPPPPALQLSAVKLSRSVVTAARGTSVSYTVSTGANVSLKLNRVSSGRRRGAQCVKPALARKGAKRCVRFTWVTGQKRATVAAGTHAFTITNVWNGRKLHKGRYRLTVTAYPVRPATGKTVTQSLIFTKR